MVGQSGKGKTQLVKALIAKLYWKARETQPTPLSVLILDYKGDFQRDDNFIELLGGRVLHPVDIPLNVLGVQDVGDPLERARKSGELTDIVDKIFPNVGPVQVNRLEDALDELWDEVGPSPTMEDLLDRYSAKVPRADGASASIRTFTRNMVFSSDPECFVSFEDLLGDQVVVLALNDLDHNQDLQNAVVALFLNQFYAYMKSRTEWPEQHGNPTLRRLNSYLVVDEATNIMKYKFPVLEAIPREGRSFGVGVILSTQYPDDFKTTNTDYAQKLVTWLIHGVPRIQKSDLNNRGVADADDETVRKIQEQGVHEAYYISRNRGHFISGEPWWRLRKELEGDGASSP